MTTEQSAAVERLTDDLPKVGEPECQFSTVNTADIRTILAALDEAQQDAAKYRNIGAPIAPEHEAELQRLSDEAVRRHHQDMADAARWRHLKRYATEIFAGPSDSFYFSITESSRDELDEAIDAARASAGGAA